MKKKYTLQIKLTVQGPFLTKSTAPGQYGVDAVLARDTFGRPYIPGTHLIGKLREACEEIGEHNLLPWLGAASSSPAWNPQSKQLYLDDLVLQNTAGTSGLRYRTRMDEVRGSVQKGAYQVIESPFGSGEPLVFSGEMRFWADDTEVGQIKKGLERGLKWIPQLGGHRTIGFGRLLKVEIIEREEANVSVVSDPSARTLTDVGVWDLLVRPRLPFCIAKRRIHKNLFESEEIIPGGVIKGAIAETWARLLGKPGTPVGQLQDNQRAELERAFERIRITHAFPSKQCLRRPVVPPLSLVKVHETLYDAALIGTPFLIKTGEKWSAPAFDIDWKSSQDVRERFGWPGLRRELRVRTQMDPNTLRSAEEQLFAYEMIVPGDHIWYAKADLSQVPANERSTVIEQLRDLLAQGLDGLGKTKAHAEIEIHPGGTVRPVVDSSQAPLDTVGGWIVTLQTPALLCDPKDLNESSGREELWKAYKEAWRDLSNGAVELPRFRYFARQSLAGGEYLYHRFQGSGSSYRPYLLTEPGSVFVLQPVQGRKKDAAQRIKDWLQSGLPLPSWVKSRYRRNGRDGDHWTNCPYVPSNGYGEIAVNLVVHQQLAPQEGAYKELEVRIP